VRGVLSVVLNAAYKDQIIRFPIPLPKVPSTPREFDFIRPSEKAAFLAAAVDDVERCRFLFGLDTGARPSEIAAIRPSDIDFHLNRIKIERSHSPHADTPVPSLDIKEPIRSKAGIKSTKNNRRRYVPLTPALRDALLRFDMGRVLLFGPSKTFTRSINEAFARAGFAARADGTHRVLRAYDLRHSYASHLALAGVPLLRIRDLLGHRSIAMTEVYAHLCPSREVGQAENDLGASEVRAALYPV
jgi:integrase